MDPRISTVEPLDGPRGEFRASVTIQGRRDVVYARSSSIELFSSEDALLPLALMPSMRVGGVLDLPAGLSPALHGSSHAIQDLLVRWSRRGRCPAFFSVQLRAPGRSSRSDLDSRGVATFFTGGVDSTFTAIRHRDEISHLVFVEPLDMPGATSLARDAALQAVRCSAERIGKPLIVVETNLREFSDRWVNWDFYHGAALATVAHLMSSVLSKVYIPSSTSPLDRDPWGSHPLLDRLWSNDRLSIVNDGQEYDRVAKLREMRREPEALSWLRVCWERPGDTPQAINCGRCRKCAGAVLALRRAGMTDLVPTLPREIAPEVLARPYLRYRSWRQLWMSALFEELKPGGRDIPRARALAAALLKSYAKRPSYTARDMLAALDYQWRARHPISRLNRR